MGSTPCSLHRLTVKGGVQGLAAEKGPAMDQSKQVYESGSSDEQPAAPTAPPATSAGAWKNFIPKFKKGQNRS